MTIETTQLFIPSTIEGSADKGGWQVSGSFANAQSLASYGRRAELYNLPEGGGVWEPSYKLALRGCVLPSRVSFDRKQSSTEITISTSDVFLSNAGLQSIYFSEQPAPANPHQMTDLRLGRIVKHIVEAHTNISNTVPGGWVDISGIDIINSTAVSVYTIRQSTSIWQTIADIASNEFYVRYFDKNDALKYVPHPQFQAVLPNPVFTLDTSNIVAQPAISFRPFEKIDQVKLYALEDSGAIITAFYPATVGTEAKKQQFSNLRCNSQARLNLLAERAYKYLNRQYNVTITIAGPWGTYLELYDRVQMTYSGTSRNGVTVSWVNKKFWINTIRITKVGNFAATTELELEEENI